MLNDGLGPGGAHQVLNVELFCVWVVVGVVRCYAVFDVFWFLVVKHNTAVVVSGSVVGCVW